MVDNNNHTKTRPVWVPSTKEQRFVTSPEQMKTLLDHIMDDDDDSDDSDCTSENTVHEMAEHCVDLQTKRESNAIKSDWNHFDEYVNFIDMSALNPIIEPADCQKDELIESEISEFYHILLIIIVLSLL